MRRTLTLLTAAALLACAAVAALDGASAAAESRGTPAGTDAVPGELLVKFEPGARAGARSAALARVGGRVKQSFSLPGLKLVSIPKSASVAAARNALERRPDVAWAEPNLVYRLAAVPNDPDFGHQWSLRNTGQVVGGVAGTPGADISATEAWNQVTGNRAVAVGVVGGGVAPNHPDLAPNVDLAEGWNFIQNSADPFDTFGHGTAVSSVIGAVGNNGRMIAGTAWNVGIVPYKVCPSVGHITSEGGDIAPGCVMSDVIAAFLLAGQQGVRVVNASLAGGVSRGMEEAIARYPNTLYVVASGNSAMDVDTNPQYPCSIDLENVVCVGATDQHDAFAAFSDWGVKSVDLAAPGTNILADIPAWTDVFAEDFTQPLAGRWTVGGTPDTWGRSTVDGRDVLTNAPGGDYGPNTDNWARMANPIDLRNRLGCVLDVTFQQQLTPGAIASIEYSTTPNVANSWEQLDTFFASGSGFTTSEYDLTAFDGRSDDPIGPVWFRFRLVTGPTTTPAHGIDISNVTISCATDHYDGDEVALVNGTSFATPLVAGAAALALSRNPSLTTAQLRSALLAGVDRLPGLADRVATSGRLNLAKVVANVPPPIIPVPPPAPAPPLATPPAPSPVSPAPAPEPLRPARRFARTSILTAASAVRLPRARLLQGFTGRRRSTRAVARIVLRCRTSGVGRCAGRLRLRARIDRRSRLVGSRAYSIRAGRRATVRIALSAAAIRVLRARRWLATTATAATRQPAGRPQRTRRTVVLGATR